MANLNKPLIANKIKRKVGLLAPIPITWRAFPLPPSKAPKEKDSITSAEMLEMKEVMLVNAEDLEHAVKFCFHP